MSAIRQFDAHPDADSLNGFIEHVLPDPEHDIVLDHIAGCRRCRDVVFLAHEAASLLHATASDTVPVQHDPIGKKKWFTSWSAVLTLGAASAAGIVLAVVVHTRHSAPNAQVRQKMTAQASGVKPVPAEQARISTPQYAEHPSPRPAAPSVREAPTAKVAALMPHSVAGNIGSPKTESNGSLPLQQSISHADAEKNKAIYPSSTEIAVAPNAGETSAALRKVVILDFGYTAVKSNVASIFGSDQDIGKAISDDLRDRLTKENTYRVVGQSELDKVLRENELSGSDRLNWTDPATAARIGGLLGADSVIVGDVTGFGDYDVRRMGLTGSGTMSSFGKLGAAASKPAVTREALVRVTARMIDVSTGKILAMADGKGEVVKTSATTAPGVGGTATGTEGVGGRMTLDSPEFQQTAIGQAIRQSVTNLVSDLAHKSANPQSVVAGSSSPSQDAALPALPVDAMVTDASTADILISVGSAGGLRVGDTLAVFRAHPFSQLGEAGKAMSTGELRVGTLTVVSVDLHSAIGRFSGSSTPRAGDYVRRPDIK